MATNLTQIYTSFLNNRKADVFGNDASLHYVTTTTTVSSKEKITAHITREALLYELKEQKIISSVESKDSVVLEVATKIEFTNGGGALLPHLDDNFLADQVVTVPINHFVNFEDNKVKQVRLYWDQGCLLKQVGVIGKSGKNWPISSGSEQIRLIKSSQEMVITTTPDGGSKRTSSGNREPVKESQQSLSLFAPRNIDEGREPVVAPKAGTGTRPPQRDLSQIVGMPDDEEEATPTKYDSPSKVGAHQPKRTFFVGEDVAEEHTTPHRLYKTHPQKYSHFDLGDDIDEPTPQPTPLPPKRVSVYGKAGTSWGFEDFTTPVSKPVKHRPQENRNFSWSDNEEEPDSPPRPKAAPKPRKDADTHFDFTDESPEKKAHPSNNGEQQQKPLSTIENRPDFNKNRATGGNQRKDQLSQFTISDESPLTGGGGGENAKPAKTKGIAIGGDGMGGRKGTNRSWGFEDEDNSPIQTKYTESTRRKANHSTQPSGGGFWDF